MNSQSSIRAKYKNGNTISLESANARVNTLVSRFRNKNSPLYLYSGFVICDSETETFLGHATLGDGLEFGTAEMTFLNRLECWSRPSDVVLTYAAKAGMILYNADVVPHYGSALRYFCRKTV